MHLEIQPDPVSKRHFQSPTCRFSKHLDDLTPTSTPPSRTFKTQIRQKDVYQSITEAAPHKRVFSRGNALYAPSKTVQSRVGREKGIDEANLFVVSDKVRHKPGCTATEDDYVHAYMLENLDSECSTNKDLVSFAVTAQLICSFVSLVQKEGYLMMQLNSNFMQK